MSANHQQQQQNPSFASLPSRSSFTEKVLDNVSMYVLAAAAILPISLFFHTISFGNGSWIKASTTDVHQFKFSLGLWEVCDDFRGCRYLSVGEMSDAHRTTQFFAIIVFVVLIVSLVLLIHAIRGSASLAGSSIGLILVICRAMSAISLFLILCIFGDRWGDGKVSEWAQKGKVDWAFGFEILVMFLEIIATACTAIEVLFKQ